MTLFAALYRSTQVAPPKSLEMLRGPETVALRCTLEGCSRCAGFKQTSEFEAFESKFEHVIPWECDREEYKTLAVDAGVGNLPAYIVIPPTGPIHVVEPLSG